MYLYFIQAGGIEGPVKIGLSLDVERRIMELQVGNDKQLRLLKSLEIPDKTAKRVEGEFHYFFRHTGLRGEWFQPTPFMLRHIDSLIVERGEIWDKSRSFDEWLSGSDIYRKISEADHTLQVVIGEYMKDGNFNAVEYVVEEILDTIATHTPLGEKKLRWKIKNIK